MLTQGTTLMYHHYLFNKAIVVTSILIDVAMTHAARVVRFG